MFLSRFRKRREEGTSQRATNAASTKMKFKEFVANTLPRTKKHKKKTAETTTVPKSLSDDLCSRHLANSPVVTDLPIRHSVVSYDSLFDPNRRTTVENFNYLNDKTQYFLNNVDLNNLSGDKCGRYKTISPCISPHFDNRKQPALTPLRLTCITDSHFNTVPRVRSRIKTNPWIPSPRASPVTSTDTSPYTSQVTSPICDEDKLERYLSAESTPTSDLPPSPYSLSQSSSSDSMKGKHPLMTSLRTRRDSLDSTPSTTDSESVFHRSFTSDTDNYISANDTFQTLSQYTTAFEQSTLSTDTYHKSPNEKNNNQINTSLKNWKCDDMFDADMEIHPFVVDFNGVPGIKNKRKSWRGSGDTLVPTQDIDNRADVNNLDNMFCSMTESGFDEEEQDSDGTVQDDADVSANTTKILNKSTAQNEYFWDDYDQQTVDNTDQSLYEDCLIDEASADLPSRYDSYDFHGTKQVEMNDKGIDWEKMQHALYNLHEEFEILDQEQENVTVLDEVQSVDEITEKLFNNEYDSMLTQAESLKAKTLTDVSPNKGCISEGRTVHQVRSSLQEKVYRLRKEKELVDKKIREAQEEERVRVQEKMRLRKQVTSLRKQILLRTLHDLKNKLENQSERLQTSYNQVMSAEWQRARARRKLTAYVNYESNAEVVCRKEAPF